MTKIAELKKKATVLDRNDMKSLLGGKEPCGDGQFLYKCYFQDVSGLVCAGTRWQAIRKVRHKLISEFEDDPGTDCGTMY